MYNEKGLAELREERKEKKNAKLQRIEDYEKPEAKHKPWQPGKGSSLEEERSRFSNRMQNTYVWINFGSHPFERLLIRDYTKNSCILFSWAEKSLRSLEYYIFLVAFSAKGIRWVVWGGTQRA